MEALCVYREVKIMWTCPACFACHQRSYEAGEPIEEHFICMGKHYPYDLCPNMTEFKVVYDGANINVAIIEEEPTDDETTGHDDQG